MSDEKIINFKTLQDKVKDSDIDKFEQYIYSMYDDMATGKLSMFEFSKRISKYMEENSISNEKFINIQKKLMERYGIDPDAIDEELQKHGIDPENVDAMAGNGAGIFKDSEKDRELFEKLGDRLKETMILEYRLENDKNEIQFIFQDHQVTLISEKKIDLSDDEVNRVIAYYRAIVGEKIKVVICEATNRYDYY